MRTRVRPDMADDGSVPADTPPDDTTLQGAYERHRDRVFDLCYHYLGQVADAEDVVQETFARAARRLPGLSGDRGAYLLAVARNLCCNELRRRRRVVPVECIDRDDRAVEAERGIVERAVLERLWTRLSPRERSLIHDTYAGFTQEEIAGRIGLSPNAVAVALLRARQRVRTYASRALAGLFPLALAWRWAQRAARRASTIPADAASALALQIQQVGMVLTAALVGALAGGTAAVPALQLASAHSRGATASSFLVDGTAAVASAVGSGNGAHTVADARHSGGTQGGGAPTSALGALDPIVNPARNAPQQDVAFQSFAASPNYDNDHTVFASGFLAKGCNAPGTCGVLYKSVDSGHSWSNTGATNFAGGQVLLPPSYPKDQTIFAMGPAGLQRTVSELDFTVVVPVTGPASIAPDSAPGNARVLVASNPMLIYSAIGKTGAVTQGPLLPPGLAQPDGATFLGDSQHIELSAEDNAAYNPMTNQVTSVVVQCIASSCSVVATVPEVPTLRVQRSPHFSSDRSVVAYGHTTVLRSVDGGTSFTSSKVPVPASQSTIATFAEAMAPGDLVVEGNDGHGPVVVRQSAAGAITQLPVSGLAKLTTSDALLSLSDGRLLAANDDPTTIELGVLCLPLNGDRWVASC